MPPILHNLFFAPRPCPTCGASGTMEVTGFETCLGYLGPHDPNCVEGRFRCPNGHAFFATTQYQCVCGWSGVKVCEISGHDKIVPVEA